MNLNIIIPMAGQSSRFNYNFKPFLYLDNRRFIEHVLDSFIKYDHIINSYNFIVTQQQELENNVLYFLKSIFVEIQDKINVIIIPKITSGPYQTLLEAFNIINDIDNIIICDSDHSLNITPIIDQITLNSDIIIPIWNIKPEEQHNWGKIVLQYNQIITICEKEIIEKKADQDIYGIIGCYYFKSSRIFPRNINYSNISDYLKEYYKTLNINIVKIHEAIFFGTPDMVKNTINLRRTYETIICDIDGVLLQHNSHSNDNIDDNIVLGNCINKFKKWKENNKKIILITARPKRTMITCKKMLDEKGIIYDDIIMGVNPGPRYLINDIKPSNPFVKQAIAYNVIRNNGINNINCNESNNYAINIVKVFKGGSFSKTYLLETNNNKFVRKYIIKTEGSEDHYEKLKRQCDDMKRFNFYDKTLVPKILNEENNNFDYYFDMEYLENYNQLDTFSKEIKNTVLNKVINKLNTNIYCYKKLNTDTNFISDFFDIKIYPKLKQFECECNIMNYLINSKDIYINKQPYYGLREILERLQINEFNTKYINPIHGDLTLENILYNNDIDDFKLIDMEGSRYVDSCYFDLGKLFQSLVTDFDKWSNMDIVMTNTNIQHLSCINEFFTCNPILFENICCQYCSIMNDEHWTDTFDKGIFYMSTYFIRFIQFRRKISKEHGIFSMIMAINWLNFIYKRQIGCFAN